MGIHRADVKANGLVIEFQDNPNSEERHLWVAGLLCSVVGLTTRGHQGRFGLLFRAVRLTTLSQHGERQHHHYNTRIH